MRGRVGFLLLLCSAVVFAACGGGGEKDRVALPFTEDFSDCQPVVDEEVTIKCVDGQASVLIKRTDVRIGQMLPIDLPRTMSSVALGVDATLAAAPGRASKQFVATGVACWISPPDEKTRGYAFIVSPRTHVYGILRVDETDPSLNKLNKRLSIDIQAFVNGARAG